MEIVWQSSTASVRKRSSQACHGCRSRKKRCFHDQDTENVESVARAEPTARQRQLDIDTRASSPHQVRLLGYNPEALFQDLFSSADTAQADEIPLGAGQLRAATSQGNLQKGRRPHVRYRTYRQTTTTPLLTEHHRRYLESVGALLELPRTTVEGLLPIYISLLDDLIPVMDGSSVFRDTSNGQASRYLVRAMCLVTCKARQAAPFLRLAEDGPLLEHQEFASKLLDGLDAAIKANLEPDRVTKIQILSLMHLHNDGRGGADRSSMYLTQAIGEAWSVSLHLKMAENSDVCDYLWWSLRNFDRLNKPTMGAGPFIVDDTDIAIDRIAPKKESYRSQILHISLILGDLMAKATKVYKASSTSTVDDCEDFPTLSDVTSGTTFNHFHRSHRAYLEIWYHLTAMLSCRYSGPGNVHYTRRLNSADRILEMIGHGQHDTFPPLPLVPYALAMSTTVIYCALCDGVRDMDASFRDLRLCCEALDTLGHRWTSAQGVAKLVNRLMGSGKAIKASDGGQGDSTLRANPSTAPGRHAAVPDQPTDLPVGAEETVIPPPVSLSTEVFHGDGAPGDHQDFHQQLMEPWTWFDASPTQLHLAFDHLFSYGVSDAFPDLAYW
ncbi:hypothetical protein EDB81DRAFT_773950 [Dactylonectria macrodidyma]|uniref:Transcription factor domain-containing protein n=1 Tax=Dactylonectria macrodidyma TaxID=307937 RepID=A0A9P9FW42_9HYPO|nr:hypothetical protein EDB81DRAFT_773950 [Dactylonectria macrodidyma]